MPIKDKVRQLRRAAGMTQQALAVKADLSISVVVHLEAGRITDPRVRTLRKIARALGVTLDDLAGENGGEGEAAEPGAPKRTRKRKGK
jgi:transcriptional regulator with XRE-family HTH domain